MAVTSHQLVKSTVGICCGTGLGLFCWAALDYGYGWAIFIGVVGSFIGFALSLPGVSASRVAGATSGMIIGYDPVNGEDELGRSDPSQVASKAKGLDSESEARPWKRPRG